MLNRVAVGTATLFGACVFPVVAVQAQQTPRDYTRSLVDQYNALRRDHPEIVEANRRKVAEIMAGASAGRRNLAIDDNTNYNMAGMMDRARGGLNTGAFGRIGGENGNPYMNQGAASPGQLHEYGKSISNSPRPCAPGGVTPLFACSTSSSFPSGHTAKATGAALLAAYIAPEKFQAFITRAQEYGESRIVAGQHYPLDVMASRAMTYKAVADLLADQVPNPNSWLNAVASIPATRAGLFGGCGSQSPEACANSRTDAFSDRAANKAFYDRTANYGFASVGDRNVAMEVPKNAEYLIATRFGYLDDVQRREVIRTTAYESGRVLDDPWSRINLFAAADGYGAFANQVVVNQDGSKGGFFAADRWMNDIGGAGGLTHNGSGMLTLTGNNSYAGGTILNDGTLVAGSRTAFGTGDMVVNGGTLVVGAAGLTLSRLTMGSLGTLDLGTYGGLSALDIAGFADLDGTLSLDFANHGAGRYSLMNYGGVTGRFSRFDLRNLREGYAGSLFYDARGLFLDVAAVPEPATWAMMIVGFAAIGAAMRRRPRPTAALA